MMYLRSTAMETLELLGREGKLLMEQRACQLAGELVDMGLSEWRN
jgi:hypothetical protein